MTLAEALAFWIFVVMTIAFFGWVAWLAIAGSHAGPGRTRGRGDSDR